MNKYEWQNMPFNWSPGLAITNTGLLLSNWVQSAAFTKDFKPADLPGELCLERSRGVVFFVIEIE